MLSLHTLTTVNNRKGKLFKELQSQKKPRFRVYSTAHRPGWPTSPSILRHLVPVQWRLVLAESVTRFIVPRGLCTVGLTVTVERAKGFRVRMVEVFYRYISFVLFLFLFVSFHVNRHTSLEASSPVGGEKKTKRLDPPSGK